MKAIQAASLKAMDGLEHPNHASHITLGISFPSSHSMEFQCAPATGMSLEVP